MTRALFAALAYILAARYSIALHDLSNLGAVFWPGAGITLTALLVSPRRSWPAILIAVGSAELTLDLVTGFGAAPAAWWALANMVEPLLAAWLIIRWRADGFGEVRRSLRFAAAVFIAPVAGGLIGAVGTLTDVSSLPYAVTVGQWVIGDGLGMLTVAPFGLVLFGRIPRTRLRSVEGVLAITSVLLVSMLVFGLPGGEAAITLDYLVLLPMVWAAVRLRVAGAAVALFVTAQVGTLLSAFGLGPFSGAELTAVESSAQMQAFLATVGVTVLLLASRTVESEGYQDLAQARQQLIDSVSHELRTPLTPIVGFSDLLLRRHASLDERTRHGLEVIHRNGVHLTRLVEDLLLSSRGRRGNVPVQTERVELSPLVRELLDDRGADAILEPIPASAAAVRADRTHLVQILMNLLDNAITHGRQPVRVEVERRGEHVAIAVQDAGDGVTEAFAPRLFDEFAQADTAVRGSRGGLGLGLPISRDLARANGGDIVHEPSERGARFVLTVPADPDTSIIEPRQLFGDDEAVGVVGSHP